MHTHRTAPTQFVEADGIRFAYRRFANRRAGVTIDIPLLFFMHFTGTMDHWDPLWLRVFFTPSEQSQAAGRKYLERQRARKENRDPLPNEKVAPAQVAALQKWGAPATFA